MTANQNAARSIAEAGRILGADRRTVKRYIDTGQINAYLTPGGHWRIPFSEIENLQQGSKTPPTSTSASFSSLTSTKNRIDELNLEIAEVKARTTLQQLREEQKAARRLQTEEAEAEEQENRRSTREDSSERENRRRGQAEAKMRQQWEAEKIELALSALPKDVPHEIILDVTQEVRHRLGELYHNDEIVVDRIILAIAARLSRPFLREIEIDRAVKESARHLKLLARGSSWESLAAERAEEEIRKLPESAGYQKMTLAAQAAVRQVNCEFEHSEKCSWKLMGVRIQLQRLLPTCSPQERTAAEEAIQEAFSKLPPGANDSAFDSVEAATLKPFLDLEAEKRKARETEAARARVESEANFLLYRVDSYLAEIEQSPEGVDFEGERLNFAEKIKKEIRQDLIQHLPLDASSGRKRVEDLVDAWLELQTS